MLLSYLCSNFFSQGLVLTKLSKGGLSELSKPGTKNIIFGKGFAKKRTSVLDCTGSCFFLSLFETKSSGKLIEFDILKIWLLVESVYCILHTFYI